MPRASLPAGITLQARDHELLRGLFESRHMGLSHAAALYFSGSVDAATKRVQKLKAAGLLDERPRRSTEPSILFLTKKALVYLRDHGHLREFPPLALEEMERRGKVSRITLEHELDVMSVKAALVPAIAATSNLSVVEFSTWPQLSEFSVRASLLDPYAHGQTIVKPDGFIRIEEKDTEGLSEHVFYLEVDRSTESQIILGKKALCYLEHYRTGGLARKFGASREQYKEFPFRVLFVCRTEERRNNATEQLLRNDPPTLTQVWLSTLPEIQKNPLGAIWIRPIDYRDAVKDTEWDVERRPQGKVYRRQKGKEQWVVEHVPRKSLIVAE